MDFDLYNSELYLAHNAPVRLMSARGVRIVCTAGRVWLTVEGEAGDILLAAGESHLVRGRGLALLEAIGDGRVRFEKAPHPLRRMVLASLQKLWHGRRDLPLPEQHPALRLPMVSRHVGA
ncbi:MAG: hypothetical protein AW10_02867 [Candidatus Accumulibacter appositus]|uniref:DUF2917 domain-containing protein n=1 Tax=Candidatus Accumulibacter appositus TaxID=1454003 RepID=A0A011N7Y9_9PROT|nr:DUF2917 domain-containing protein [Accumulibacter sp.]EXI78713.1 MAG: hypothetical protein AW10_02867 [Candidatus Accumulibacter appositus]HRF03371.1 DUF2917 domain-containing protein [Accumulibacter sp.]